MHLNTSTQFQLIYHYSVRDCFLLVTKYTHIDFRLFSYGFFLSPGRGGKTEPLKVFLFGSFSAATYNHCQEQPLLPVIADISHVKNLPSPQPSAECPFQCSSEPATVFVLHKSVYSGEMFSEHWCVSSTGPEARCLFAFIVFPCLLRVQNVYVTVLSLKIGNHAAVKLP